VLRHTAVPIEGRQGSPSQPSADKYFGPAHTSLHALTKLTIASDQVGVRQRTCTQSSLPHSISQYGMRFSVS